MVPLFKTHFSVGKSLLTPRRCFELAKDLELPNIVFVEDSFGGFRKIQALSEEFEIQSVFGIQISAKQDNLSSKIVLVAKNNNGLRTIREIYSEAKLSEDSVWDINSFKGSLKDVKVCIPFFQSYLHKNIHEFGIHDIKLKDLTYFLENSDHPYSWEINRAISKTGKCECLSTKTILYETNENFKEYQFYRSCCNRSGGKNPAFGRPELDDCGSDKFSWEEYKKCNNQ